MKQEFNKIVETIYSIENLNQIDVCKNMIKQFGKKHKHNGHEYYHNLKGILFATNCLKFN